MRYENQLQAEVIVDRMANGESIIFTFDDPDLTAEVTAESCGYFITYKLYDCGKILFSRNKHCSTAYEISCELNDAKLGVWE